MILNRVGWKSRSHRADLISMGLGLNDVLKTKISVEFFFFFLLTANCIMDDISAQVAGFFTLPFNVNFISAYVEVRTQDIHVPHLISGN